MHHYKLTQQAKNDLIQIRHFSVEYWGAKQSKNYLHDFKEAIRLLAEMPTIGKNCFDDLGQDIYRFVFRSHVIYYTLTSNTMTILTILHQSMSPEKHLDKKFSRML